MNVFEYFEEYLDALRRGDKARAVEKQKTTLNRIREWREGVDFVDIAYLKKEDLKGNKLTYVRRKSGYQITIKVNQNLRVSMARHTWSIENRDALPIHDLSRQLGCGNLFETRRYLGTIVRD